MATLNPIQQETARQHARAVLQDGDLPLERVATAVTERLRASKAGFEVGCDELREAFQGAAGFDLFAPEREGLTPWARLRG